jgi:hypothetical protein
MKKNLLSFGLVVLGMSVFAQTPRLSLFEEFTGENCNPCAGTNPGLNVLLRAPQNASKIVAIKWQVPIPSAPVNTWSLYKTDKTEIDWRYGSSTSGYGYPAQWTSTDPITSGINAAPTGLIDGQHQWVFGAASDHPANLQSSHIANAQAIMSPFSVTMLRDWNATGTAVNVTVNITASMNFTSNGNLVFRTVMVERNIEFATAPGSNGEKDFEDVAIKSFPSIQSGTPLMGTWTNGQSYSFTLSCTIPSYCRKKEEIAMVGFIQSEGDRKVHQAVRADRAPLKNDAKAISAFVDVTCNSTIDPKVMIMNNGADPITAMTITPYSDGVAGTPFMWTGNLAANTSTNIPIGTMQTATSSGPHTFSYNITAMNAVDFNTTNNTAKVTYLVVGGAQGTPVAEGFLYPAFPPASATTGSWTVINPNAGLTWQRESTVGGYNVTQNSAKLDCFHNSVDGDIDELILPPMDLSGADDPMMFFDLAYAQQSGAENDKLEVLASFDCGGSWAPVYSKTGSALATTSPQGPTQFIPSATDWTTEYVTLPGFNKSKVIVKFVGTNNMGNTIYIDNVNLYQPNPTGINTLNITKTSVAVYPNPASTTANVKVISPSEGTAKVTVINALGQVVYAKDATVTTGVNNMDIDVKSFASGIYSVVIDVNNTTFTKKLTVSK